MKSINEKSYMQSCKDIFCKIIFPDSSRRYGLTVRLGKMSSVIFVLFPSPICAINSFVGINAVTLIQLSQLSNKVKVHRDFCLLLFIFEVLL